jgi:hypothetical protein
LTQGRAIRLTPPEVKDSFNLNWRTVVASEIDQVCIDPGTPKYFENYPSIQARLWVRMAWCVQPVVVLYTGSPTAPQYDTAGNNTTKIPLADEYAQVLVNFIVARANMRESEWADRNKAQEFASQVTGWMNSKVAAVTGTNPNLKTLPFSPAPIGQAA